MKAQESKKKYQILRLTKEINPRRVHLYGRIFENTFAIDTDDINTDVRSTVSFKVNR